MAETYAVRARIISQKGTCAYEHKVGDEWVIKGRTPDGLCMFAFDVLFPFIQTLMFDGTYPWESNPDVTTAACPDAQNPVVFELTRLRKQPK